MALTKAQRAARNAEVAAQLRMLMWRRPRERVELTMQDGRRRPRVAGFVHYVATSGAFVLLNDHRDRVRCPPRCTCERHLHVPVDVIRSVRTL